MPAPSFRRPWPVQTAIVVLVVEAVALLGFSGWLMVRRIDEAPSNEQVFEGAAVYLTLSGALVALVALALRSGRGWAYGAAVVVQLIGLGVAYEMARADFWAGAAPLAAAAAVALAALLSKPGRGAFGRGEPAADDARPDQRPEP